MALDPNSTAIKRQLEESSEVILEPTRLPLDKHCHCRRCGYEWTSRKHSRLPARCPKCRSAIWSRHRMFRCLHCGHEFVSDDLYSDFYSLFCTCPKCERSNWHKGVEKLKRAQKRWAKSARKRRELERKEAKARKRQEEERKRQEEERKKQEEERKKQEEEERRKQEELWDGVWDIIIGLGSLTETVISIVKKK